MLKKFRESELTEQQPIQLSTIFTELQERFKKLWFVYDDIGHEGLQTAIIKKFFQHGKFQAYDVAGNFVNSGEFDRLWLGRNDFHKFCRILCSINNPIIFPCVIVGKTTAPIEISKMIPYMNIIDADRMKALIEKEPDIKDLPAGTKVNLNFLLTESYNEIGKYNEFHIEYNHPQYQMIQIAHGGLPIFFLQSLHFSLTDQTYESEHLINFYYFISSNICHMVEALKEQLDKHLRETVTLAFKNLASSNLRTEKNEEIWKQAEQIVNSNLTMESFCSFIDSMGVCDIDFKQYEDIQAILKKALGLFFKHKMNKLKKEYKNGPI